MIHVIKETLKISTGENVINLYYTKKTDLSYTVNYLEKDTNKVLKAQKVAREVTFDTEVTIDNEKIAIDGYVFDSAIPEGFKVGTNLEANVMNIYYTKRSDLSYKVNYLDIETKDILHEQKVVGNQVLGTKIDSNSEIIEINGYVFDSFDKTTITIGTGENVINIYYTRVDGLTYTVNYVEKDNEENMGRVPKIFGRKREKSAGKFTTQYKLCCNNKLIFASPLCFRFIR